MTDTPRPPEPLTCPECGASVICTNEPSKHAAAVAALVSSPVPAGLDEARDRLVGRIDFLLEGPSDAAIRDPIVRYVDEAFAALAEEGLGEWVRQVRQKFRLPKSSEADPKDYWTGYAAAVEDVERLAVAASSPAPAGLDVAQQAITEAADQMHASTEAMVYAVRVVMAVREWRDFDFGTVPAHRRNGERLRLEQAMTDAINDLDEYAATRPAEEGPITDANGDELEHGEPDYPGQDA